MSTDTHFSIHIRGCAAAAYKINESRDCVMDLTSVLLESQDNVRQIHMLNRVLGIRSVEPVPPAGPASISPRPIIPRCDATYINDNMNRAANTNVMHQMDRVLPISSRCGFGDGLVTTSLHPSATTSIRTFAPVSTMQRLTHAVRDNLPMDVVASNALVFVAAWRREDERCAAQEDLFHECLSSRHTIEVSEEESRWRLQYLLIVVTEKLDRFLVLAEYDKFNAFCVEHEPVWRQAARQLQNEKSARLNTTENIYARFFLEDTAVAEKTRKFQEAADFVVSLCLVEREQRATAQMKAMERRRRQSASQVVKLPPTLRGSHSAWRDGEPGSTPRAAAPSSSSNSPQNGQAAEAAVSGRVRNATAAAATQRVKPLTAVTVDDYREGWRTMLGFLTNGERGRLGYHNGTTTTAAATAASAGTSSHHAAAAANGGDGKHKSKSPVTDPTTPDKRGSKGKEKAHEKAKNLVFPQPKEKKVGARRPSRDSKDKDNNSPLPPVSRDGKRSQKDNAAPSPSPPAKSRDERRGHYDVLRDEAVRQSGRSADEAATRKTEGDVNIRETLSAAANAVPPKRADGKRHHHH